MTNRRGATPRGRGRLWIVAGVALAVAAAAALVIARWTPRRATRRQAEAAATYVGADACAGCHRAAYDAWLGSQHRQAMADASSAHVAGRFSGAHLTSNGLTSTMFSRDGRPWVRTDDALGALRDFPVAYTFGVFPLQQYLVEQPRGRLQALPMAWDARPAAAGGQRWFHLYPDARVDDTDPLHWTGREQNWNFMCADCHSTAVRKGYDEATDTYATTWSAMSVSCEACHGPGSRHVAWAAQPAASRAYGDASKGLTVSLDERRNVQWSVEAATGQPIRSRPRVTSREIDTCAVCHSRRAQFADGYRPGDVFEDFYEPVTLDADLYFPDGQQRDEVYTYGSFLQSRMAHAGVTCSDCHDPHGGTLRASGNALCTRCHMAARYDTPAHHHHETAGPGAACVACHMPARTYMQIDDRRDHSLRVPRPDLTLTTGAPNACTACHRDKTAHWAAGAIHGWIGRDPVGFQDFGAAFHAFDAHLPGADDAIAAIAESSREPAIVRASALARLSASPAGPATAARALADPDPMVRRSAVSAFAQVAPRDRLVVVPRLSDPVRSVRVAAARVLAIAAAELPAGSRAAFDRAAADFMAAEHFQADRPEHRVSLGVFLADLGERARAAEAFRAAIRLAPDFAPAYVNLAELQRTGGDEPGADATLRTGLAQLPGSATLHYALGLSLTRAHRAAEAIDELRRAASLAPAEATFTYAYALALNDAGHHAEAIATLVGATARHPDDPAILLALGAMERDAGLRDRARQRAARLLALDPANPDARALADSLAGGPRVK